MEYFTQLYHSLTCKDEVRPLIKPTEYTHLIVVQHGLWGSSSNVGRIARLLKKLMGENALVIAPDVNSYTASLDGIQNGGDRIFSVVEEELAKHPSIVYFSCVGYSLGGLYMRYVIGKMEANNMFVNNNNNNNSNNNNNDNDNDTDTGNSNDNDNGNIRRRRRRLVPLFYASMATPHLGSLKHTNEFINGIANSFLGNGYLGLTGRELSLQDRDSLIVYEMAKNTGPYLIGLSKFKRLMCFANTQYDRTVPYHTAAIFIEEYDHHHHHDGNHQHDHHHRLNDEEQERKNTGYSLARHRWITPSNSTSEVITKYPHIVDIWTSNSLLANIANDEKIEDFDAVDFSSSSILYDSKDRSNYSHHLNVNVDHNAMKTVSYMIDGECHFDIVSEMRENLNRLHWKKIDVSLPGPHTHGHIVVRNYGKETAIIYYDSSINDQIY